MKESFEDKFSGLQADMIEVCLEYCEGLCDSILIYICHERFITPLFFFIINGTACLPHKINDSLPKGTKSIANISENEDKALDILIEDTQKIESLCKQFNKPMPTEIKINYNVKTKKMNAEYKYTNQLSEDIDAIDIFNEWFKQF